MVMRQNEASPWDRYCAEVAAGNCAVAESFEQWQERHGASLTDETFERVYQQTVDFIAGRFGEKETYRVFGRFLLGAMREAQS